MRRAAAEAKTITIDDVTINITLTTKGAILRIGSMCAIHTTLDTAWDILAAEIANQRGYAGVAPENIVIPHVPDVDRKQKQGSATRRRWEERYAAGICGRGNCKRKHAPDRKLCAHHLKLVGASLAKARKKRETA